MTRIHDKSVDTVHYAFGGTAKTLMYADKPAHAFARAMFIIVVHH